MPVDWIQGHVVDPDQHMTLSEFRKRNVLDFHLARPDYFHRFHGAWRHCCFWKSVGK